MKKVEALTDHQKIRQSVELFKKGNNDLAQWQQLTQHQYSHNTLLGFKNDWQCFVSFCLAENLTALPAEVSTVRRFIQYSATHRKAASIKRYVVTIGHLHRLHQQPDPTRHREVRFTLNQFYQQKIDDASQANAFQLAHLQALEQKFAASERIKDIRDLLIWRLSFEVMLKRSELAAICCHDLTKTQQGYLIQIKEQLIEVTPATSALIDKWLTLAQITEGPLLRRLNKHGHLGENSLDHSSIYRVFRRAATELELTQFTFSGQSARVGASQDMATVGKSIREIQHQGRWKSPAMPAQYVGDLKTRDAEMQKFKRKLTKE